MPNETVVDLLKALTLDFNSNKKSEKSKRSPSLSLDQRMRNLARSEKFYEQLCTLKGKELKEVKALVMGLTAHFLVRFDLYGKGDTLDPFFRDWDDIWKWLFRVPLGPILQAFDKESHDLNGAFRSLSLEDTLEVLKQQLTSAQAKRDERRRPIKSLSEILNRPIEDGAKYQLYTFRHKSRKCENSLLDYDELIELINSEAELPLLICETTDITSIKISRSNSFSFIDAEARMYSDRYQKYGKSAVRSTGVSFLSQMVGCIIKSRDGAFEFRLQPLEQKHLRSSDEYPEFNESRNQVRYDDYAETDDDSDAEMENEIDEDEKGVKKRQRPISLYSKYAFARFRELTRMRYDLRELGIDLIAKGGAANDENATDPRPKYGGIAKFSVYVIQKA